MKYYIAYGSNLSIQQMLHRCPDAIYIGYAIVPGYQLVFRRTYLTIEPKKNSSVPVLVWQISDADERSLDRYEGCPTFYRKEQMSVEVLDFINGNPIATVDALVYIMNDGFEISPPSAFYWQTCREGYLRFGFDVKHLMKALPKKSK